MTDEKMPLVKGGQGRSGDSLEDDAMALFIFIGLGGIFVFISLVFGLIKVVNGG